MKICSLALIVILFLSYSSCINLKNSLKSSTKDDTPQNPVYYYKETPSWYGLHGLIQYYGTYCLKNHVVSGNSSKSKPGWLYAYYTCDQCSNIKDKYLQHPIGLIFGAADRPQRIAYISEKEYTAYRCH